MKYMCFAAIAACFTSISSGATKTPEKPTTPTPEYCRSVRDYSKPDSNLYWRVRSLTLNSIESIVGHHYRIGKANTHDNQTVSPALEVNHRDRITIRVREGTAEFWHSRGDEHNPVLVSSGTLTLAPTVPHAYWAYGDAYAPGNPTPVGVVYVFRRFDKEDCEHPNYHSGHIPSCRRILFEYFDTNDSFASVDKPNLGSNVYSELSKQCPEPVFESSDGEGDEGPNKPR